MKLELVNSNRNSTMERQMSTSTAQREVKKLKRTVSAGGDERTIDEFNNDEMMAREVGESKYLGR